MVERHINVFVAVAAGKAAAMACNIMAPVIVGRMLGPGGLGRWTLLLAAGTLLHTGLVNWTHTSTVRYGREEWTLSGSLNRTLGARLPLLAASVAIAVLFLWLQPARWADRWFGATSSEWWLVGLVALSVWLAAEAQAGLQATNRIIWQAVVAPVVAVASTMALLGLAFSGQPSLEWAVIAFAAPAVIGWAIAGCCNLAKSQTRIARLVFDDIWRHLRYAAPVLPTFALGYLSDWGDHLLLSRFSTLTQVGLFGIAYQFMVTTMAASGVLVTMLLPRLIANELSQPGYLRIYVEHEIPTLYALWMLVTVWVVALVPPAAALAAGPQFGGAIPLLLVLLIMIPSSVVASLYTVLFSVQERMGRALLYLFVMAMTNVVISLLLIPTYGAAGAAAGTVVSYVVYQASYVWDQHRTVSAPAFRTWALWATGLVLGVAQWAVGATAGTRIVWAVAATAVLIALIRSIAAVDPGIVARLFAGRLRPVGVALNRVLAPPQLVAGQ